MTLDLSLISNQKQHQLLNPFPNTPFGDISKLKEAADDNCNVALKGLYHVDRRENINETGEIAHF